MKAMLPGSPVQAEFFGRFPRRDLMRVSCESSLSVCVCVADALRCAVRTRIGASSCLSRVSVLQASGTRNCVLFFFFQLRPEVLPWLFIDFLMIYLRIAFAACFYP